MESNDLQFIATIMAAARKVGIFIKIEGDHAVWYDPNVRAMIKCEPADSKDKILLNACKALQNFFNTQNGVRNAYA